VNFSLRSIYRKMMTEKKKEYFKNFLTERLDALLDEANRTVTGMTDQGDNFPDPTDRASLESDRNFTLRIRDRERKLIVKIKEALERLENGTYGICDECGEDISEQRLKARPVTTLCSDCKKKQESEERLKGL
jgi:DnaK suppressor protein